MAFVEISVSVGVKVPGPNGTSVRHEIDLIGLSYSAVLTASTGAVEIVGGGVKADLSGVESEVKVGGVKGEVFSHGKMGALVGGTIDPLNGEIGGRAGIGFSKSNAYVEISVDVNLPEDPDGGYNGAGIIGPGYNGYGQIIPYEILREPLKNLSFFA
jgi:hypothetical protein